MPVETRERARLGRAVGDAAEIVETDLAAARKPDRQRRKIPDAARARERADRLFLARDLAAPTREIDIGRA